MRHVLALLAAVLLAALPAPAAAQSFVEAAPVVSAPASPVPVTEVVATASQQEKVQESARAESLARDDRQLGPRGGFWWIVGVIVVAGVILAVLL
jgi:hypothetical protein